ncbi:MAG: transporter [Isosphaera sp.]|nr:transporter [Isosphaera sp.]
MSRASRLAALALGLGLAGPSAAQYPSPLDSLPTARAPAERPGSPAETLESLTGERSAGPGRERDEVETDRDSFTPATTTAGRRRLIVEAAYTFADNRRFKETHSVPELILRYGLTERVELRFGFNYEVGGEAAEATGAEAGEDVFAARDRLLRESTLSYGVKVGLTEQRRWVPRSAVIVQGFTPTRGSAGAPTATQVVATYAAGWELPNRWRFDAAVRYGTASEAGDRFGQFAPSAVLRVPVGERLAVHGEYFGIVTTGRAVETTQHFFSPGVHYLVTPDLEVGVRLGWGLNDQSPRFFSNVGFGLRF